MMTKLVSLRQFDTPTVCNALERIDGSRRSYGYTTESFHCINGSTGPRVGLAFTATMRSLSPSEITDSELKEQRLKYYEYMYSRTNEPKVCVMQDLDGVYAGHGPFWGEFNTRIHRAMGFDVILTDGTVRDVTKLPDDLLILSRGLRPSHAHVHVVNYGIQVTILGMAVSHGDVVHADEHGAVTFSVELIDEVAKHAQAFIASEAPIIEACKTDTLSLETLRQLYLARYAPPADPSDDE